MPKKLSQTVNVGEYTHLRLGTVRAVPHLFRHIIYLRVQDMRNVAFLMIQRMTFLTFHKPVSRPDVHPLADNARKIIL